MACVKIWRTMQRLSITAKHCFLLFKLCSQAFIHTGTTHRDGTQFFDQASMQLNSGHCDDNVTPGKALKSLRQVTKNFNPWFNHILANNSFTGRLTAIALRNFTLVVTQHLARVPLCTACFMLHRKAEPAQETTKIQSHPGANSAAFLAARECRILFCQQKIAQLPLVPWSHCWPQKQYAASATGHKCEYKLHCKHVYPACCCWKFGKTNIQTETWLIRSYTPTMRHAVMESTCFSHFTWIENCCELPSSY